MQYEIRAEVRDDRVPDAPPPEAATEDESSRGVEDDDPTHDDAREGHDVRGGGKVTAAKAAVEMTSASAVAREARRNFVKT